MLTIRQRTSTTMTHRKDDDLIPLWNLKPERLERWKMRLEGHEMGMEEGKQMTCAARVYNKMINEDNIDKFEKYLHDLDKSKLRDKDGIKYLYQHFEQRCGLPEVQELGVVIEKYFKIGRQQNETMSCYDMREVRAHNELSRVMTALSKTSARLKAEQMFVASTAQGAPPREDQLQTYVDQAAAAIHSVEMPEIVRGWQMLKNSRLSVGERSHIRAQTHGQLGREVVVNKLKEIWPDDELHERDRTKHVQAKNGRAILACIEENEEWKQRDEEVYWQQNDQSDWQDSSTVWSNQEWETWYGEGDDYDPDEDDVYTAETEMGEAVGGDIEEHVCANDEPRSFETAHKEKLEHKKSRGFFDENDIVCTKCMVKGHSSANCTYGDTAWANGYGSEEAVWWSGSYQDHQGNEIWSEGGWCGVNYEVWNNEGTAKNTTTSTLMKEVRGRAVLDCGATKCVAGVQAIDQLQEELLKEGTKLRGDHRQRSRVRFGDNKTIITHGTIYIPWNHGGVKMEIPVGVLPDSPMPLLLSRGVMKKMKIQFDFVEDRLTTPKLREQGAHVQARTCSSGHLLLPMTKAAWNEDYRGPDQEEDRAPVPSTGEDDHEPTSGTEDIFMNAGSSTTETEEGQRALKPDSP